MWKANTEMKRLLSAAVIENTSPRARTSESKRIARQLTRIDERKEGGALAGRRVRVGRVQPEREKRH